MTIAVWPDVLPPPEQQSWQATYMDPRLKRQADSGPPSYRRRFSSVAKPVTMSLFIERSDKAVFDQFYEQTTSYGSLPFYMPDPTTDGWPILLDDGSYLQTGDGTPILMAARWLCLFGDGVPTEGFQDGQFRISFSIVVMP